MTNTLEFSQQLALSLYESTEEFPVDLDEAYQWLGYSRKDAAKRKLVNNFIEGIDYVSHRPVEVLSDKGSGVKEQIKLTTGCFKELGMLAGTEKGKQVRQYFLQCEKLAKKATEVINPALLEYLNNMQREMKVLSARTQRLDAIDNAVETHKGIGAIVENEVEDIYPDDIAYTVREYLVAKGVSDIHLHTMRKRAVMFASQGKQNKLPKKSKEYLFVGNDISYLDQALKTALELD